MMTYRNGKHRYTYMAWLVAVLLLLSACRSTPNTPDGDVTGTGTSMGASESVTETGAYTEGETADPDIAHVDADDDGLCDDCELSVMAVIDFYAINDLHGKVLDGDKQPGLDELTSFFKEMQRTEEHVILLSAGDMWQGSSESNLTEGLLVTDWMNELGFASMTLGNHEFDWGEDAIEGNAALAEFPLLAINVYDRETGRPVDYCTPSVTVECGGATVGIIGAIGDCYSSISGEVSGGIYFKVGSELTALVKAESERLRAEGADFIVYALHDGGESGSSGGSYYDKVLSDGAVDLVFEGHTHQSYVRLDKEGVYHLQGGGENRGISHAEVAVNFANGHYKVQDAKVIKNDTYDDYPADPLIETLMDKYADRVDVGDRVVGQNDCFRYGDQLRELVAKLYYEAGVAAWGEEYNIVLGGGFISVRSPYNLASGEVKYADLQALFPFDNTLVLCSIKGEDLRARFIETDNENYFNYYGSYGESVKGDIDPNATYYVVVDTYSSTYAPNRLTEVRRYTEGVYARDLLADYIAAGGLSTID